MRISNSTGSMLCACAVVAMFAGCSSGGSTPINSSSSLGQGSSSGVTTSLPGLLPALQGATPGSHAKHLAKQVLPNVYVADSGHNAVKEILSAGGYTRVLKLGSGFKAPTGVAIDRKGDVFVADNGNNAVKEMLAVDGGIPKNPTIKTLTTAISTPYNVALDYNNNVFVTNNGGSVVYELLAPGYTTINTLGSFLYPTSVAVDSDANVYVGTAASTSEIFEMLAPSYTTINTLGGGEGVFLNPYGLAVDRHGNVYIGDYNNSAVQMMPPNCASSSCVTTLTSEFYRPTGVAVDRSGNVYGADYASGEVFEILRKGGYKTINALGSGFKNPWQVAVH
jgi:streptogramin lyase